MGGGTLADKSGSEMVIKEVMENFELGWERGYIGTISGEFSVRPKQPEFLTKKV